MAKPSASLPPIASAAPLPPPGSMLVIAAALFAIMRPRDPLCIVILSGLQYISADLERLIIYLYPTFVMILGAVFLGQRVSYSASIYTLTRIR